MQISTKMLINGSLVDGDRSLEVKNPATGKVFVTVACGSKAQAEEAFRAAKAAQPAWEALGWEKRKAMLLAIADAIEARREEAAELTTREHGKPLAEARGEVDAAIAWIRFYGHCELTPDVLRDTAEQKVIVSRKAIGVVLAIAPWNFPFLTPCYKLAPALVAGNALVLKPAATAPLGTLMVAEIAASILPAGVFNVVTDDNDLGGMMTSHMLVDKVSFTGSTATGLKVVQSSPNRIKRITLELGDNGGAIVLRDVDVEKAADGVCFGAFHNAGQACLAIKRAYVEEPIYEAFCEAVAKRVRAMAVGDGLQPGTELGPIQNEVQFAKARHYLDVAHRDGRVIAGGSVVDGPGYFIQPTVVRDIEDGSELVDQEQFSPILPIIRVADVEEALQRINGTEYGLCGSVWTRDVARGRELAARIQAGTVWINQHQNIAPDIPTSGAKQSGVGVEWGIYGLEEYTQVSVVNEAASAYS
jgi:acyl-CoA reductase-like NAD-dependent aldehyde dehydrogenase